MADNQPQQAHVLATPDSSSNISEEQFATPTGSPSQTQQSNFITDSPNLQAGHTYIIQSLTIGHMLTLLNGNIVLAPYDTLGCMYWSCHESSGHIGLRNVASGRFLRHAGLVSGLSCSNTKLEAWERLSVREAGGGSGHVIFMEYWGGWRVLGLTKRNGEDVLDRITDGEGDVEADAERGVVWMFFEAHELEERRREGKQGR